MAPEVATRVSNLEDRWDGIGMKLYGMFLRALRMGCHGRFTHIRIDIRVYIIDMNYEYQYNAKCSG